MKEPRETIHSHYPLTRTYSLTSLAGIALVAILLAYFYRTHAVDALQRLETEANVTLAQVFANSVWGKYGEFVSEAATLSRKQLIDHPDVAGLREDVLLTMGGLRIVKIKIYDRTGLTVFSTEGAQIGEWKGDNEGFRRALAGDTISDIVYRDQFNAFDQIIEDRDLLSSYVPVRYGTGETVAVFELYSDLTPLLREIEHTEYTVVAGVSGLMFALFLFLLFFVRRADTLIKDHEKQESEIQQERIRYLAQHDQLTGLPNRVLFIKLLNQALQRAQLARTDLAILFLDIDRFKLINDNLGQEAGNQVLLDLISRIGQEVGGRRIIGRMGGDEFTLILDNIQKDSVDSLVSQLSSRLSRPYSITGTNINVTVSMGITLFPDDNHDAEHLIKDAEAAMLKAKELGRNRYTFFTADLNAHAIARFDLEHGLHKATSNQEFELHYQPRVDAKTGMVLGVEALLRWRREHGTFTSPALFIPLLEEMGLIVPVGAWVLRTACRQCKQWQDRGFRDLKISVNLSMRQFRSDQLLTDVRQALVESGLAAEHLELELTESTLADSTGSALKSMRVLKELGVHLSIDDFGTGYSSLSYLMNYPIDYLKIDQSFVRDVPSNPEHANLARAIASMAKSLNMKIVAEGVENEAHRSFLTEIDCDELQGYFFSRPLSAEQLPLYLKSSDPVNSNQ